MSKYNSLYLSSVELDLYECMSEKENTLRVTYNSGWVLVLENCPDKWIFIFLSNINDFDGRFKREFESLNEKKVLNENSKKLGTVNLWL